MSSEEPDFQTRLSRRTAEHMGLTWDCPRRQCRRGRRCMASVSPEGEPACVSSLNESVRLTFAAYRDIANAFAHELATNAPITIRGDIDQVYIEQFALAIAHRTYAENPATRALLRHRIRRIATRWLHRRPRTMGAAPLRHDALAATTPGPAEGTG